MIDRDGGSLFPAVVCGFPPGARFADRRRDLHPFDADKDHTMNHADVREQPRATVIPFPSQPLRSAGTPTAPPAHPARRARLRRWRLIGRRQPTERRPSPVDYDRAVRTIWLALLK